MTDLFLYDLAYHYDALSILEVKARRGAAVDSSINRFDDVLGEHVGRDLHLTILNSPEYARMVEVNTQLFDAFDWLHTAGLTAPAEEVKHQAIQTDRINGVHRPAAKRALQERWFGAPLAEVKLGYGEGGR